jgi:eukaryotic-like serine/threonine-protein kinase
VSLAPGTRLGPYEIRGVIGAGAMGEVYRAHDTKLRRDVAVKVLPDSLATDPERLSRFEREAQALAAISHPNIAAVHAVEDRAIIMELVDGEDLAERIGRGALPLDEALPIAREIADALDAAHAQGIVHRDLKPANIRITPDGHVKVLDFGLAKALAPAGAEPPTSVPMNSPTMTARATHMGVILGTAAYMAPEQARGRAVDRRADIWAFGCVFYEMLTGRRLFDGENVTDVLSAVVREEPDVAQAPPNMRRLLKKCLEKDPKRRLRDIGDAWDLIDDTSTRPPPPQPRGARLPWIVAAFAAGAIGAVALMLLRGTPAEPQARFEVPWPGAADTGGAGGARFFQVSPDGRALAIVSQSVLWVRPIDSIEPTQLEHTEGATYPFWSPDGTSIGFFAGGQLKRIARTAGPVRRICDAPEGRGAAWSPNGTIVFSQNFGYKGLLRVSADGGNPVAVTKLTTTGASDGHRYPQFLPDGEHFLYLSLTGDKATAGVYAGSLSGSLPVRVLEGQDNALYAPPAGPGFGHLLFRRGETLMAQGFDTRRFALAGEPFPVAEGVGQAENTGLGAFSISPYMLAHGAVINAAAELVWRDRSGSTLGATGPAAPSDAFSLSRDRQRLAVAIRSSVRMEDADIWVQTLPGGSPSKFTFGPSPGWSRPAWSPDGREIAYATADNAGLAGYEIHRKRADMTGSEDTLLRSGTIVFLWEWSGDGKFLVYSTASDLWLLPLDGTRTPVQFTKTPGEEEFGQVSPDGKWLAYASADRGQSHVYVQSMREPGQGKLVSANGGSQPRWRADGKELFYRATDGQLMAVPVAGPGFASPAFEHGTPVRLPVQIPAHGNLNRFTYDAAADGQRFLVRVPVASAVAPITAMLNWQSTLKR